jgi:fluoride ion exporter CrcB/FEX
MYSDCRYSTFSGFSKDAILLLLEKPMLYGIALFTALLQLLYVSFIVCTFTGTRGTQEQQDHVLKVLR